MKTYLLSNCIGFKNYKKLQEAINTVSLTTDLIEVMNINIIDVPINNYNFLDFLDYLIRMYF